MRSVSASRGRCTPGRSTSTSCQSGRVATPRIARRVVCGRSETIATLRADDRVDERRLADVRPAGERDEAGAGHVAPSEQLALEREHLAVIDLVVHPEQVQHAVDDRLAQVGGVRRADHDVAELARAAGGSPSPSIGNDSTSVGSSSPRCSRLSSRDPLRVDERDREVAVVDARRRRARAPGSSTRRRGASTPAPLSDARSSTPHAAQPRSVGGAAPAPARSACSL